MRRSRPIRPVSYGPSWPKGRVKVLVLSASMGAGHDGAARELAARLKAEGHSADVKDFLQSGPLRIGMALRRGYEFELRHVPSAYEATYRLWYKAPWLCPLVTWLVTVLTRRKVTRWVSESNADVVVSTYPLATLCLGRLRATGRLSVPAVNFITDFGVHPLWVHRGIDLNLAVHDGPAVMAAKRTGQPSFACGPVVSAAFDPDRLPNRAAAREALGLQPDQKAVLVVAGSWGVGDLQATWNAIAGDGRFTPVVVCGRDPKLQQRVEALAAKHSGTSVVLGWTDAMPSLMAACDALVENAGGLTSLEAMRAGLPVVSFHPIAGHGKENTAGMASAGVSRLARDGSELAMALAAVTSSGPDRDTQVALGQAMFRAPATSFVLNQAKAQPPIPVALRRTARAAARLIAAATGVTALGWAGLTTGVAMATEAGAGVAHPAKDSGAVAYIGVKLNAAEVADPSVVALLRKMNVTAVVDDQTATANVAAVRHLVAEGVNLANGGLGDSAGQIRNDRDVLPWNRARGDARAVDELEHLVQRPVAMTIPGRRLTAWDLLACRKAHTSLVVPDHILNAARVPGGYFIHLTSHDIYLVNGMGVSPGRLVAYLSELDASLETAHLAATPLATLA